MDIIDIESVYFSNRLVPNLKEGAAHDFMAISYPVFMAFHKMGYQIEPRIHVSKKERFNAETKSMEKVVELYKSEFVVLFDGKRVTLRCSVDETIRKICAEIARYFVIQSSSIRVRRRDQNGSILDRSHTLAQHRVSTTQPIYVEIRAPNGCWPVSNSNLTKFHQNVKLEFWEILLCQVIF